MTFDIVIGRSKKDLVKYGKEGTILLGKQYIEMGQTTSLSNPVYLDIAGSHVVFIVGKRGSGKSYSLGAIAEGLADLPLEIKQNLSIILLDTMGIYWTMKYPNFQDAELAKEWGFEPKAMDVKIYTPAGFFQSFHDAGIPTDFPFSIQPFDVGPEDWCNSFELDLNSPAGVLLTKIIQDLNSKEENYSLDTIIKLVQEDTGSDATIKSILVNQFEKARGWGIFSEAGTPLQELAASSQITVLDLSPYATIASGWAIKALVVGLIGKKLFRQRMLARKTEEFKTVDAAMHYFTRNTEEKLQQPLVWLALDEAHELLPREGKTTATEALITILREGRQPGISLILASQQPGKIHTDVITQADTVLAHRVTAKPDVDALGQLMQSYMRQGLDEELKVLPPVQGSAIIFDDVNERLFPIQVRPRFTWHGGGSPMAIPEKRENIVGRLRELKL